MHNMHTIVNISYNSVVYYLSLISYATDIKGVSMTNTKQYLGARIQELRKRRGLKQSELAEKIGIDSKHMSKLECGRSYPSFDLLDKIAHSLETTPSELLDVEHLIDKEGLIEGIVNMLKNSDEERIRRAYKILREIL